MKFPLAPTVQIAKYVAQQQRKGERYPLVLMLEPTLACNIACIGCGKIREYESNKARLSVEECIDAGEQCPAPVVSICGGEPLVFKGIEDPLTVRTAARDAPRQGKSEEFSIDTTQVFVFPNRGGEPN